MDFCLSSVRNWKWSAI